MILFKIVDNLFTKLKEVYGNPYYKEYIIEKFRKLKMGLRFFNTFYSDFIKLAAKFKFIKEMLLQEFIYKLSSQIQNWINSGLEYPDNIKDLVMHCQKIYD